MGDVLLQSSAKPRRKVVKKHIAEMLEQVVSEQPENVIKTDKKQIQAEVDQVCFCKYGEEEPGYQRCMSYQLELSNAHINHDTDNNVSPLAEYIALMSIGLPILKKAMTDPDLENKHCDIQRHEVEWLVHFIEMLQKRSGMKEIEQNIYITYFGCFRPLFQKLNNDNKGETSNENLFFNPKSQTEQPSLPSVPSDDEFWLF